MKKSIAWVACAGLLTLVGCVTETTRTTATDSTTTRTRPPSASMSTMDRNSTAMNERGPR